MSIFLLPISSKLFDEHVNIKFNNILDGLDNFLNFTLENKSEEAFINFIIKVFQYNNNYCYIDLYLSKLSTEDKNNLLNLVPDEDKELILSAISLNNDTVYYKVTDKFLLPFLIRLSTREIFFITFYFTEKPITIWGNYNKKFPCFFDNQNEMNFYIDLWNQY